ncbi:MAG: EamA family transporter [Gammaproteobacteria bacterium]|nr:EamA family transporter [Gammaproteobacteria bacterium]
MIENWIILAILAAFFQNLRSALQKHLKGRLSDTGAAYARFLYALPLAMGYLWALQYFQNLRLPIISIEFLLYCLIGGICQIMFTVFLLRMFSFRSFAVGTTFSKLEVAMVALLGSIFLGDTLSLYSIVAIAISTVGVIALSMGQSRLSWSALVSGLTHPATLIGLICALWLGGSVVFFRGAALSLNHDNVVMAAAFTLAISLTIQTVIMGFYLVFREVGEITKVVRHWRWAGSVGIAGGLASIAWFTAFTIENAGHVRAVGQIELIFTFLVTTLIFKEKVSKIEGVGIILVASGILILLIMT